MSSRYNRLGKSLFLLILLLWASFLRHRVTDVPKPATIHSSHLHIHLPLRASFRGNSYALSRRRAIVAHAVPRLSLPRRPPLNPPPPRFCRLPRNPFSNRSESQTTTTTTVPWILAPIARPRRAIHSNMATSWTTIHTSTHCHPRACPIWDPAEPTAPPTLYTCRLL